MNSLFNFCLYLANNKKSKCSDLFNEIQSIENLFYSNISLKLILVTFLIFIFHYFISKKLLGNIQNKILILLSFLTTLFYFIIIVFSSNFLWVDDWSLLDSLFLKDVTFSNWLFRFENIHNHSIIKFLVYLNNVILNLDFQLFNYLSVFFIYLSSIIFIKTFIKLNLSLPLVAIAILFMFSGKLFPSITQLINISWTLNFLLISLFSYNLLNNKTFSHYYNFLIIILAPNIFGSGFAILGFSIIFGLYNLREKIGLNYIIFSILSFIFAYILPKFFIPVNNLAEGEAIDYINIIKIFYFPGFFGNVFFPWSTIFSLPSLFIGYFQLLILIYFAIIKKIKIRYFISNNPILIISIFTALLVAISRPEISRFIQPRYVTISILFQIGFLLFLRDDLKRYLNKRYKNLFLTCALIYIFSIGTLTPYLGVHWQAKRSLVNYQLENCFKLNVSKFKCKDLAYEKLFYGGNWYSRSKFNKLMDILFIEK